MNQFTRHAASCVALCGQWCSSGQRSAAVLAREVSHGLLALCSNSLALLGLVLVAALLLAASRADLRYSLEQQTLGWLQDRQEARDGSPAGDLADLAELSAVDRATAADPSELPRQQASIAHWLARRYKVAPEPISRLVQEAWATGQRMGIEPTLVLAVMAVESGFNPFAQSAVGAQGLMQVMTRIHDDKYKAFGGTRAAFDPVTNLRVGMQVLKECIVRAGSLEAGLRAYVGAALTGQDGGYVNKVLAEQAHLRQVSSGKSIAVNVPLPVFKPLHDEPAAAALEAVPPQPATSPASSVPNPADCARVALLD